jgi:PAS domain S-box-containing protein
LGFASPAAPAYGTHVNWITLSWPAAIAACVTLGLVHAKIALHLRAAAAAPHALFCLSALAVAGTGAVELLLLHTHELHDYRYWMRVAELPLGLMMAALGGFACTFLGSARRRCAWTVAGLVGALVLAHFLFPEEWSIRHAESVRVVETLGKVRIAVPTLRPTPLMWAEAGVVMLLIVLVADASRTAWRRGERSRAVLVGGGIIFFLTVSRLYALQVETGRAQTPFFFIFPFLALLLAMGRELGSDVIRSSRIARELAESEHRMALAAQAASLGCWSWDLATDHIWASAEARRLFGLPAGEPVDFPRFLALVEPAHRDPVRRQVEAVLEEGRDYEMEYRIHPADGRPPRWIGARGRVERGADGRPLLMRGVLIDVSERKHAQLEAEAMRQELMHVSRVTTLGELAASLAHELNQPLAAILSNAQAARRVLSGPAPDLDLFREILEDIIADDKRAGEVIHRLRALVQRQDPAPHESIALDDLVSDLQRLLHGELVSRNVALRLDLAPDLPPVRAGRVEMQQVLINLVVNALDALRDLPPGQGAIGLRTRRVADGVRLEVVDNGPGVPTEWRERIFRPFCSTKAHGLGMGLAICRTIVELAHGRLGLEDAPGGGSVFFLELPADRN